MTTSNFQLPTKTVISSWATPGLFVFLIALIGAGAFFSPGLDALLGAWQKPEYSHGPIIPLLSALLFLRQLKDVPMNFGEVNDRSAGVVVVVFSLLFALMGKLANIDDIVAYGLIVWFYGILLCSFGWKVGLLFWPPILHLVYMLPLPDTFYYKLSTWLQFISSELGVWFLKQLRVPVFLEGNIIDLGVYKLHVAEACSGLRYLFPIMSFSYVFAVLYRGPTWHKAVLLLSAAPITVIMNSIRIAVAGVIVNNYGIEWVDGFTHFFEGWVIFLLCILFLFILAKVMLTLQKNKMTLVDALDLDTDGLATQAGRLRLLQPSKAMITIAGIMVISAVSWQFVPERNASNIERDSFALFPRSFDDWRSSKPTPLESEIEVALGADDYWSVSLRNPEEAADVGLFMAWYADQSQGGVHSPEVCLPGGGWEISWLERTDIAAEMASDTSFNINKAVIQKGENKLVVFYWFQQRERRIAWDLAAKFWLMFDGIKTGRTDGSLVRLTTVVLPGESEADAEDRLLRALKAVDPSLPRFLPAANN